MCEEKSQGAAAEKDATPPTTQPVTHGELLGLWGVQEGLLQAYRGIFITIQSVFLSVGSGLILALPKFGAAYFLAIAIGVLSFYTIIAWDEITTKRGAAVSFCQKMVRRLENGEIIRNPLQQLNHHLDTQTHNDKAGSTRSKLRRLPAIFASLWALLSWTAAYVIICG